MKLSAILLIHAMSHLPRSFVVSPFVKHIEAETNGRHFADDTFKRIFLNENIRILIKNSLKFVPKGLINNIPALVLIMAWRRPGDKPLSEPMMISLLTHICVTRPQWVKHMAGGILSMNTRRIRTLPDWDDCRKQGQCNATYHLNNRIDTVLYTGDFYR